MSRNLIVVLMLLHLHTCPAQISKESVLNIVPKAYYTTVEMPDMLKFLPAPPDFHSPFFINDSLRYVWGKNQRLDEKRAEIAKRDAVYGLNTIIQEFSTPFGLEISRERTPHIYTLLEKSLATCDSVCKLPKEYYMRKRPYVYFNEPTLVPDQEESHKMNGSYPSGHTILGWSAALLLMEINPEAQDTLLARGYMFGESRVIAGYHWQSDVDAGRLAASAAYAKLHTNRHFLKQMKSARKEFLKLTKKNRTNKHN
jgi:acid phosphatase (class A)